ncbi:LysR substrate-binding domain-containing protein [Saccharopolyspora sp. NFXS83]|uniref:LysR substrate-binding domain-containing protein n=1 Tax=Saccharopolyspora sp. NFXS83 TaxID=2993560 RepID=UPI00224A6878|nr:LysR substrate-binding domain-containing protein [Saccharopolyspora sp. NFXS83]MCX2734239.1 LysR substrate-binding domain-containing protein [Saccharopolyspora sp. NFXS83]
MADPDPTSLRLLVLISELGSIGAAAAQLRISQPSASKRLTSLERGLGLHLVERTRRGATLTPAGRTVLDHARHVLTELDALTAGVHALRARHQQRLRVAASMTIADYLAPRWLTTLRTAFTELRLELDSANSATVTEAVRHDRADLGFLETPDVPDGLSARYLTRDRMAVVAPPAHPWTRRRTPLDPAELAATPLIVREHGSGTRETLERALASTGATPAEPLLELHSTTAVRNSVVAGAGPAVLSALAVDPDLRTGQVVEIPIAGIDLHRPLHAVWRAGHRLTGPAAALLSTALSDTA